MEKRKPHHDLEAFKAAAALPGGLAITTTALKSAAVLGFGSAEVVGALQMLERHHFYKSMTAYANSHQWQDVYHLPCDGLVLYVKFTANAVTDFTLLSFKEKDDG
ncbi:type II toxin-antitoxin system MqsR family toxin [Parvibaculum sp.]|uniref:type II toxin-antitoxin system MqsR family toxin n=1 Tax=Parvibaculum sp. TaxID=2024848 RepID=UPI002724205D|nr:type II toxin-antitoxin system MqsR family toxin [Parvibaculum sp.]MDO9126819.1 type II toxin-antitoxin system MqsR family toxin [Parvibaculum sp.]MDP1626872.1 type II toxin-antitoxin system MqsR family toxin [Parvibaculum sp.]MDP2148518.1 type II toxin-antitoxin system MqsR family toxin [Parvibaculum sp.]MDP3329313.1 type II toxin-antitoxin system MqsR family toxin [Parvibaculum sp.]